MDLWVAGRAVPPHQVELGVLLSTPEVVLEEATYFHAEAKLAGKVVGALTEEGRVFLRIRPTGTHIFVDQNAIEKRVPKT